MIVVTGAQGFIGSVMIRYLNSIGISDIIAIDHFKSEDDSGYIVGEKYPNLQNAFFSEVYPIEWNCDSILPDADISGVFHFGAISNTLERDDKKIQKYNVDYTRVLADVCKHRGIPMVFSSSAAVYGHGNGPVNPYAQSKLQSERDISSSAVCLRFFNVYGSNEYHKGRMSSVVLKWYTELQTTGKIKIFENSKDYRRDFIYVEDVCRVAYNAFANPKPGVYDLGTGISESFETVADCVIKSFGSGHKEYVQMPADLQYQYQKNTQANTESIRLFGWAESFTNVSDGVGKYFEYLVNKSYI